ncbi:MAG: hypothetical protein IJD20_00175 [Oscillospiraceae bacterium]|nr:hypothetical protein [Oscillospiraceae bacterium]
MEGLFLPTLHTFENDNVFTGSFGELRFKVTPQIVNLTPKEVDFEKSSMKAEYWHGPFCYEKSEIEGEREFPLTEEGKAAMLAFLMEQTR